MPGDFGKIYIYGAFWNAPDTGILSKSGMIIHKTFHFTENGTTKDYAHDVEDAQALARNNPPTAVVNADNYQFFAENNPRCKRST